MGYLGLLKFLLTNPTVTGVVFASLAKLIAKLINNQSQPTGQASFWLHTSYLALTGLVTVLGMYLNGNIISAAIIQSALSTFTAMLATHFIHNETVKAIRLRRQLATGDLNHVK